MTVESPPKDLVILVADNDAELAVRQMLSRDSALGIRPVHWDIYRHPERDPGCRLQCAQFLRPFLRTHEHAMVVFDREGCGSPDSRHDLEEEAVELLARNGWTGRCAAIALDPELEIWVWSRSREVDRTLGWAGRRPGLRDWLAENGLWPRGEAKPERPKEALQAALREVRKPRSPSLYQQLAQRVSLTKCSDSAFDTLRSVLREWFPPG